MSRKIEIDNYEEEETESTEEEMDREIKKAIKEGHEAKIKEDIRVQEVEVTLGLINYKLNLVLEKLDNLLTKPQKLR